MLFFWVWLTSVDNLHIGFDQLFHNIKVLERCPLMIQLLEQSPRELVRFPVSFLPSSALSRQSSLAGSSIRPEKCELLCPNLVSGLSRAGKISLLNISPFHCVGTNTTSVVLLVSCPPGAAASVYLKMDIRLPWRFIKPVSEMFCCKPCLWVHFESCCLSYSSHQIHPQLLKWGSVWVYMGAWITFIQQRGSRNTQLIKHDEVKGADFFPPLLQRSWTASFWHYVNL